MNATETMIDTLNSLLRGELAATETYQQALALVGQDRGAADLHQIHVEHREAANTLRQQIHQLGGKPDQSSGAWGAFAKAVEGAAKLFGNAAALKALKEGEEHGAKSYADAAQNPDLSAEYQSLIRSKALPRIRAHIAILDRLIAVH